MFLRNFPVPFVTQHFAERLGQLVISEQYQEAVIASDPPEVLDKGDSWSVTVKVQRWVKPPFGDKIPAPTQFTVSIRKKDAAILSVR